MVVGLAEVGRMNRVVACFLCEFGAILLIPLLIWTFMIFVGGTHAKRVHCVESLEGWMSPFLRSAPRDRSRIRLCDRRVGLSFSCGRFADVLVRASNLWLGCVVCYVEFVGCTYMESDRLA